MALPVIIDTDIGNDIDDTWAVAMALRCPEIDVRLITASTGDPVYRASLVADLLGAAGRPDIPIGLGCAGHSDARYTLSELADPRVLEQHQGGVHEGVDLLIELVEQSPEPVTVLALGPLTTVAAALRAQPRLAERARLVGMQGSHRTGYRGQPGPVAEYNVAQDVEAAREVFAAPWTCTLTPLDTCGTVVLRGDRCRTVRAAGRTDRLVETVLRHQKAWLGWWGRSHLFEHQTGVLYDTVAVYLCYDESLVDVDEVRVSLADDGIMHPSPAGPRLRLACRWRDEEQFLDHLVCRLSAPPGEHHAAG